MHSSVSAACVPLRGGLVSHGLVSSCSCPDGRHGPLKDVPVTSAPVHSMPVSSVAGRGVLGSSGGVNPGPASSMPSPGQMNVVPVDNMSHKQDSAAVDQGVMAKQLAQRAQSADHLGKENTDEL